jgi:two-component system CheB/CheR fusion protein
MIFADRLQELRENMPVEGLKYIDKINTSTQRMSNLIEDLLNFSKILKEDKSFVPTDLKEIFNEVIQNFDMLLAQKKGKVIVKTLPVLEAIPLQMKQLFYNIINNALKFTEEDTPPVIEISSRLLLPEEIAGWKNLDPSKKYHEIRFSDNGIGFEEKFAEQIFVIFQRLNNKNKYSGTGIGLALCKRIADNHSGEIYARPNADEGASFYVILPEDRN